MQDRIEELQQAIAKAAEDKEQLHMQTNQLAKHLQVLHPIGPFQNSRLSNCGYCGTAAEWKRIPHVQAAKAAILVLLQLFSQQAC